MEVLEKDLYVCLQKTGNCVGLCVSSSGEKWKEEEGVEEMEDVVRVESENWDEGADVEVELSNKEKELDNDIGVGKDSIEEVR